MNNRLLLSLTLLCAPLAAQGKKVDFHRQVFPILEKNCVACHRATYTDENGRQRRPKGRVMFDTRANIEGSKGGKLFVANKPDESLVIESITLPADDEDRMPPPKEGGPLAAKDVELIRQWIAEGADFGKWTGEEGKQADEPTAAEPTAATKQKRNSSTKGPPPLVTLAKGLRPVAAATLASFADSPFRVQSVGDDSPLLKVSCCGHTDEVTDAAMQQLASIADHVFELDLARSRVADGACATIARMPRLVRLDLRQTRVTDVGIKDLASCAELRTLNLFDTDIGDYALLAIASLKKLEKLYVWQTDVSTKGVVRLRQTLPDLDVVTFAELPEPAEGGGNDPRRRR